MKKILTIIIFVSQMFAQGEWRPETAYTLPQGRLEFGLFQPVRWGQSDDREISFYKLSIFVMPGITLKQRQGEHNQWTISSTNSVYYPTPLLKMLAKEGTGGLISPEFEIPQMVSVWKMVLASKSLDQNSILTIKAGFALAFGGSNLRRSPPLTCR